MAMADSPRDENKTDADHIPLPSAKDTSIDVPIPNEERDKINFILKYLKDK